jgi:MGT family glycosyltransferase
VLEELERNPVDVVAVDFVLLGAAAAAERAGIPYVMLWHTVYQLPRAGAPAPGGFLPMGGVLGRIRDHLVSSMFLRIFGSGLPALNEMRGSLGLEPVRSVHGMFSGAERVLILTSADFDYPEAPLPANARHVGAPLDDPAWTGGWSSPWPADHPDPLVVVGLSTTNMAQHELLQRIADALGDLPVRGLVTTGYAVDPDAIRVSGNVKVVRQAPHAQVFREASAVVTHAGHGTVVRALASGLPLVCVPMGRDQPDVAARVVHAGAGVRLTPKARVAELRTAIRKVLEEPGFRDAARLLGRLIAEDSARDLGVTELEVAAARADATRPALGMATVG